MRSQTLIQFIGVAAVFCGFLVVHQWLSRTKSSFGLLASKKPWVSAEVPDISLTAHNATLGFEKVFYISLPYRSDRQDMMSMLASTTNVSLTVEPGVIGNDINDKAKPANSGGLSGAQMGCWRSHANLWKRMMDENIQTAIIMEDDADWDVDVHNIFERFSRHMQSTKLGAHVRTPHEQQYAPYGLEWDLIYLGTCWDIPRTDKKHNHETYEDPSAPNSDEMSKEFNQELKNWGVSTGKDTRVRVVAPSWYSVCTVGYAISLAGARKLLYTVGNGEGLAGPVDLAMIAAIQKGQISALAVVPPMISPWRKGVPGDSDITESLQVDETAGSNNMKNSGRKALKSLLSEQKSIYDSDFE